MGKKKDARRAAKVAARERREKILAGLAQDVSVLRTRANTADARIAALQPENIPFGALVSEVSVLWVRLQAVEDRLRVAGHANDRASA